MIASIQKWPRRWLPVLRRQLNDGGTANALVSARLLDEYGDASDLIRVRAFGKTYRRQSRSMAGLGTHLARRVAPVVQVGDLGRTELVIGDRVIAIASMRRKSAALLMFLVTRPGHSATRDQALDQLWPDADPHAATNNLNQSLYFLRRDIDPWFEEDISVDYVGLQGDVVWLNGPLVRVASADFMAVARARMIEQRVDADLTRVIEQYTGQFCPEFEYEEWAMSWRASVHALFLEFVGWSVGRLVGAGQLGTARDIAVLGLQRDPSATDRERKLIWLYWHGGSKSAAVAQYEHLASVERADGLDPDVLDVIVQEPLP